MEYVHRYPEGPHELFDLRTDPDERTNLVDDPAAVMTVEGLRSRLEDWFSTYVDPARDGVGKGVTGSASSAPWSAPMPPIRCSPTRT